jgi:SAM-dependent methyltransferase
MSGEGSPGRSATIERFTGFASEYDRYRPSPPEALADLLGQFIGVATPPLVVDLGSGTGLSTRYWADRATRVVGIEPSADMRERALQQTSAPNIQYLDGVSNATRLPGNCARIVTCVQSLHWMQPDLTYTEVRRILEPGGVFAAVDYDWPPVTPSTRADRAWADAAEQADRLEANLPGERPLRWDKPSHLSRMEASRCFRFTRECALHHADFGDAARFVGLLRSQGGVMDLLKAGYSEAALQLPGLEELVERELGPNLRPWFWTARVRIGVV